MDLTREFKYRFYAHYLGSSVDMGEKKMVKSRISDPMIATAVMGFANANWPLILRGISAITKEESIEICKILDLSYDDNQDAFSELVEAIFEDPLGLTVDFFNANQVSNMIDYLRLKGIAIPFMGHPVHKLVDMRWIILQDGISN